MFIYVKCSICVDAGQRTGFAKSRLSLCSEGFFAYGFVFFSFSFYKRSCSFKQVSKRLDSFWKWFGFSETEKWVEAIKAVFGFLPKLVGLKNFESPPISGTGFYKKTSKIQFDSVLKNLDKAQNPNRDFG